MTVDARWTSPPERWAIETRDLVKSFRRTRAVAGLNLNVPQGGVHGLLGPNGSGKTTTLRMLLGLVRPDDGSVRVLGREMPDALPEVIDRIGAVVESPKLFPTMTLRRNLEILATSISVPRRRVTEVLLEVGLGSHAGTQFRKCSLGMKQRAAIAATLLKTPDLLIFDEPTNGLDPAGIHEIRTTMRALADAGRTVLVSSHDLSEIEQVADSVTVVGRGRTLAEGELSEFLGGGASQVEVEVADVVRAREVLAASGHRSRLVDARLLVGRVDGGRAVPSEIARILGESGLWPSRLVETRATLEQVYLELTAAEHLTATQGRRREAAA